MRTAEKRCPTDMHAIRPVHVDFSEADRREILACIDACLRDGHVSQGHAVEAFEEAFARYTSARHAVAVSSGTAALEIAARVALEHPGTVLVPANGFFSTAVAPLHAGANIRLVDIDPATLSPGVDDLEAAYSPDVVGVMIIHMGGIVSPSLPAIRTWCDQHGVWLCEDCAHAHGSRFGAGRHAGTCGVTGAFSFFATKVITSAEGGMLITDDERLAQQYRLYRNLGKRDAWVSHHVALGTNARMSEFNAVIGLTQLRRLDEFLGVRNAIAGEYTRALAAVPGVTPVLPVTPSSWYKYPVLLPAGTDRGAIKSALRDRGIEAAGEIYDTPLHRQPVFQERFAGRSFPKAEEFCARHICLPIHSGMTPSDARRVVEALAAAVGGAG